MNPCSSRQPGCFQPRFLAENSVTPSQDSEQHDFLGELADQLAAKFSLKNLNTLIRSVKLFVQTGHIWRQVCYFSLL